jgi:hypothetical protein
MKIVVLIFCFSFFSSTTQALTEHIDKIELFKKSNIKKIELECRVNNVNESGKSSDRWFSSLRNKFFFDFNLQNKRLEGMGFGQTRNVIKPKNQPFFFTTDEKKKYIEVLMVIPDLKQIHSLEINYLDDEKDIISTSVFYYAIYQLGEDSFYNFAKFHYINGKLKEFQIWKENYHKALNLHFKDKFFTPSYRLTKIDFISSAIGICDQKNVK